MGFCPGTLEGDHWVLRTVGPGSVHASVRVSDPAPLPFLGAEGRAGKGGEHTAGGVPAPRQASSRLPGLQGLWSF